MHVRPKKHLGQHFLKDKQIAQKIVDSLETSDDRKVIEIGPGTGVLTDFLFPKLDKQLICLDVDKESIAYLHKHYPQYQEQILLEDFLKTDLSKFGESFDIIGNFPYNISSQIYFRVFENKEQVHACVGMIQKEVADRIASKHGNKVYGILSVLLQLWYDVELLFDVPPDVFDPPPKVVSSVLKLTRNSRKSIPISEKRFKQVVKQGFNNRRKTLRNALKPLGLSKTTTEAEVFSKRAEQLSVDDFIALTELIEQDSHEARC